VRAGRRSLPGNPYDSARCWRPTSALPARSFGRICRDLSLATATHRYWHQVLSSVHTAGGLHLRDLPSTAGAIVAPNADLVAQTPRRYTSGARSGRLAARHCEEPCPHHRVPHRNRRLSLLLAEGPESSDTLVAGALFHSLLGWTPGCRLAPLRGASRTRRGASRRAGLTWRRWLSGGRSSGGHRPGRGHEARRRRPLWNTGFRPWG
jgi:hypothetical protein